MADGGVAKGLRVDASHGAIAERLPELYARYARELTAFVRTKVGAGPPDPEDVAQQAFVNFAQLKDPRGVENPRAFLYRTALNIIVNDYRRMAARRRMSNAELAEIEHPGGVIDFSPEALLLKREELRIVERAMDAMPARRRRLLVLHRIDGLSYAEIARREGMSESGVRKQVAVAVRECGAALLDAELSGEEGP